MAVYNKAAQLYQRNSIETASPARLTLMLYDGAVKVSHIAIEAIEEGDIEKAYQDHAGYLERSHEVESCILRERMSF